MLSRLRRNLSYINASLLSRTQFQPIANTTVICSAEDIRFYANTPNTIIYFKTEEGAGYFRECKKHTAPRDFVWRLIEEYCKYVYRTEHSDECEVILKEKLLKKENFDKFFNMGAGTADYTRISKFRHTGDSSWIGINEPFPEWFRNQLLTLVQYAWGALDEYKYCRRYKLGEYHIYNANRTITTKRIVDMIGADMLVPETKYIKLILDGEEKMGVSVGVAPGFAPEEIKVHAISPEFQRQSLILNVADVICFQKDHRPGNYFVTVDNGVVTGLSAFDNDCPTTLFNSPSIAFTTYSGCAPIVDENGYINRPFLDKGSTQRLLKLVRKDVDEAIQDSSSRTEQAMLWRRIHKLQEVIKKSLSDGKLKLLDVDEFSNGTIREELSGVYGVTYAKLFVNQFVENDWN